jgi:hypothetical protein
MQNNIKKITQEVLNFKKNIKQSSIIIENREFFESLLSIESRQMNQSEMKDIEKFINDINFVNVQINRVNKSLSLLRSRISNSLITTKSQTFAQEVESDSDINDRDSDFNIDDFSKNDSSKSENSFRDIEFGKGDSFNDRSFSNSIQTNKAKTLTNVFNYLPTSIQKATMNNAKKFYRNQKNDKDLNNNTKDRWGISATIKICSLNIFGKPLKAVIDLANKPRNIVKNMFSTGISSKNYNKKE